MGNKSRSPSDVSKRTRTRPLVGRFVTEKEPPALKEGQKRCPSCRNGAGVTPNGFLRQHKDLFGNRCWNKDSGEREFKVEDVPINVPPPRGTNFRTWSGKEKK